MTESLTYTVAIHGSPYSTNAHQRGLQVCQAIVDAGHGLSRIFFYHDAVLVATATTVPPQDEFDAAAAWAQFANQQPVELAVCIAAGIRRGVLSEAEAKRYEVSAATLQEPFELVGLGQLIDAIASAERYLEIPA